MTYRLYTEKKNKVKLQNLFKKRFSGFSVYESTGFWNRKKENSLIFEFISEKNKPEKQVVVTFKELAEKIKVVNNQKSILIQIIPNNTFFI